MSFSRVQPDRSFASRDIGHQPQRMPFPITSNRSTSSLGSRQTSHLIPSNLGSPSRQIPQSVHTSFQQAARTNFVQPRTAHSPAQARQIPGHSSGNGLVSTSSHRPSLRGRARGHQGVVHTSSPSNTIVIREKPGTRLTCCQLFAKFLRMLFCCGN